MVVLQDVVARFRDYISKQNRRDESIFRETKERLEPGTQNLIANDVLKLVTEVEILRAEREQLRDIIQSLKEECSTLSRESNKHLKEMQAFQAIVLETLDDSRIILGSYCESESVGQIDQTFSDSTSRYSSGRLARYAGRTWINGYQHTNNKPLIVS